jgi:hypothetical protein
MNMGAFNVLTAKCAKKENHHRLNAALVKVTEMPCLRVAALYSPAAGGEFLAVSGRSAVSLFPVFIDERLKGFTPNSSTPPAADDR